MLASDPLWSDPTRQGRHEAVAEAGPEPLVSTRSRAKTPCVRWLLPAASWNAVSLLQPFINVFLLSCRFQRPPVDAELRHSVQPGLSMGPYTLAFTGPASSGLDLGSRQLSSPSPRENAFRTQRAERASTSSKPLEKRSGRRREQSLLLPDRPAAEEPRQSRLFRA